MKSVARQGLRSTACALLMSDAHASVLQIPTHGNGRAYCAYGYHQPFGKVPVLLAFNGECAESQTGNYLLGNGNRTYNPVLMRFHSTDPYSPFEHGGLNTYAYCLGDPINNFDPTGNWPWSRNSSSRSASFGDHSILMNQVEAQFSREKKWRDDALRGHASGESYGRSLTWEKAEIKRVEGKEDLVKTAPTKSSSWVLTRDGSFVVGTFAVNGPKLSHAAIADYAGTTLLVSPEVIAAGELKVIGKKEIFFDDRSGHYLPHPGTRSLVREYLNDIGIAAKYMIIRTES